MNAVLFCEIWGFHGDDISCRSLLGCDNVYCCDRIPTSRRFMPPPSSGRDLLGYDAVNCCGRIPTFQRSMLPPSSGWGLPGCDAVQCCGRIPTFQRSMLSKSSPWNVDVLPQLHSVTSQKTWTCNFILLHSPPVIWILSHS